MPRAPGLNDRGMIAPGMRADLALWDVARPDRACHHATIGMPSMVRLRAAFTNMVFRLLKQNWSATC